MNGTSYFLGVDGGGSKTTAVAADENGHIAAIETGGSINYYSNPLAATRANMAEILAKIKDETGVSRFKGAFIGMSALNGRAIGAELEAFAGGVIDADNICMDSDLYIALETLLTKGACAVVISGTGSMVTARDSEGIIRHTGGWGYLLGDEGSGYRLSLDAIRAGIRGGEGSAPETALTKAMLDFYKAKDFDALVDIFYNPPISRQNVAAFLTALRTCADNGDETAADILNDGAEDLAKTALALLKNYSPDIPVGLWGGVFQYTPSFLRRFSDVLAKSGFKKAFLLKYPPEIGAVFAAYKLCGITADEKILTNIGRGLEK